MGDLSRRLSRWEFACRCKCGQDTVDSELVTALEDIADYFENKTGHQIKIHINSGNRCKSQNIIVGGADDSQHLISKAADFWLEMMIDGKGSPIEDHLVNNYLEQKYPNEYGIGRYVGRTHLDVRSYAARWDRR